MSVTQFIFWAIAYIVLAFFAAVGIVWHIFMDLEDEERGGEDEK